MTTYDASLAESTLRRDFLLPGLLSALIGDGRTLLIAPPGVMRERDTISPHNHGYDLTIEVIHGTLCDRIYTADEGRDGIPNCKEYRYFGASEEVQLIGDCRLSQTHTLTSCAPATAACEEWHDNYPSTYTLPAHVIHSPFVPGDGLAAWVRYENNRRFDGQRRLYNTAPVRATAPVFPTREELALCLELLSAWTKDKA